MTTAFLSIVGRKGSGKSDVLSELISHLSAKGFRVGVLKRLTREDVEIDEPGTDTYQYRTGGAETVVLAGKKRLALFSNLHEEIPLKNLFQFFEGFDLVFLEGYVQNEFPKIEIHKKELGELLLTEQVKNVIAICSDGEKRAGVPHFLLNELNQLASLIEQQILKTEDFSSAY